MSVKRQVCPNCGTVQPGERRYCVSCGERLDDNASEYIDSRLYFERKPWMNVVVAVLLVLAVGNIVLTVVYGNTHYVWVPFICAVWFVFAAVVFAFPTVMYMVFGYIWAYGGRYRRWRYAHEYLPEDIDDPYPESIRRMYVVFAALSLVAVVGCVWFALDVSSFVIMPTPAPPFTFPSDIEITPYP